MILAIIRGGWKSAGKEREGEISGRGGKRARRDEKVYANEKKKKRER